MCWAVDFPWKKMDIDTWWVTVDKHPRREKLYYGMCETKQSVEIVRDWKSIVVSLWELRDIWKKVLDHYNYILPDDEEELTLEIEPFDK